MTIKEWLLDVLFLLQKIVLCAAVYFHVATKFFFMYFFL